MSLFGSLSNPTAGGKRTEASLLNRQRMDSEASDLQYSLLNASVETYQQVLETYRQRSRELRVVVDRYMAA